MEQVRVSRRELALLCRYVLVQAELPIGCVNAGGRLIAAAQEWYGGAVRWMLDSVDRLTKADPTRIATATDDGGARIVAGAGESVVLTGIVALDLATIDARRSGAANLRMVDCSGTWIAPALVVLAAARGFAALVSVPDGVDPGLPAIACGAPGRPFVWLSAPSAHDTRGDVLLALVAGDARQTLPAPIPVAPAALEGVMVPFGAWVGLLDLVGGTLPPDGRGFLTRADVTQEHQAGPGTGRLHDDD